MRRYIYIYSLMKKSYKLPNRAGFWSLGVKLFYLSYYRAGLLQDKYKNMLKILPEYFIPHYEIIFQESY